MSKVFSIDSDGIWKACTTKVITKTAITTVASRDWSEVTVSLFASFGLATKLIASGGPPDFFRRSCGGERRRPRQVNQDLGGGVLVGFLLGRALGPARELQFSMSRRG